MDDSFELLDFVLRCGHFQRHQRVYYNFLEGVSPYTRYVLMSFDCAELRFFTPHNRL